jgi:hypothetical protein
LDIGELRVTAAADGRFTAVVPSNRDASALGIRLAASRARRGHVRRAHHRFFLSSPYVMFRVPPLPRSPAPRHTRRVAPAAARVVRAVGAALLAGALAAPLTGALDVQVAGAQATRTQAVGTPPAQLPAATLRDQFGSATTLASPPGVPVVVLASNREGSEAAGRWERQIRAASAGGAVRVLSVADLRGAPRVVRGLIRSQMPKDTAARVLLDWDGALGRPVRGADRPLVAAAYGRDGRLRHWEALSLTTGSAAVAQTLVRAAEQP